MLYSQLPDWRFLHLEEFYRRVCAAADKITNSYEIVLVNDGSPDSSLRVALDLVACDSRVKVVDLSRNFGHHRAMMTGLAHARGDLIFLIDCDQEEDPDLLGLFHAKMKETDADVVFGVQHNRKGGTFEGVSGGLFFRVFNALSDFPVPHNLVHIRLMTCRYVEGLLQHRDREVYVPGLMAMTGFVQVPFPIQSITKESKIFFKMR